MNRWRHAVLTLAGSFLFILGLGSPARAVDIVYNAAADFSATNNPNGVWSYGWSPTLGAPFILDTAVGTLGPAIDQWRGNVAPDGNPGVIHNRTGSVATFSSISLLPGQLAFHPGPGNQYALVRWTAPEAGFINLATAFSGVDVFGTTTDVHVLHNGTSLFAGLVLGFGPGSGPSFAATRSVLPGDTIDFAVGFGPNMTFFNDSTGLDAIITLTPSGGAVPEPAGLTLLGIGALGVLGYAWRRRKRIGRSKETSSLLIRDLTRAVILVQRGGMDLPH